MTHSYDCSIVIPLKNGEKYIEEALNSCIQQETQYDFEIIVCNDGSNDNSLNLVKKFIDKYPKFALRLINSPKSGIVEALNFGIENANSEWVTLFEFDDEYAAIWFDNVKKYSSYYPNVQAFMPVVVDVDEKGVFAGFTNEAVFAANFAMELGYLTNDILQDYQNFQSAGMVFKKSVYDDFGGFKSSIKLTFVYEFLLRLTYNSVVMMTIPKFGYKHTNMREGSIFWNYKNGGDRMIDDEVKFWVQTAKKEYFFKEDRTIKYESSSN